MQVVQGEAVQRGNLGCGQYAIYFSHIIAPQSRGLVQPVLQIGSALFSHKAMFGRRRRRCPPIDTNTVRPNAEGVDAMNGRPARHNPMCVMVIVRDDAPLFMTLPFTVRGSRNSFWTIFAAQHFQPSSSNLRQGFISASDGAARSSSKKCRREERNHQKS